MVQCGSDPCGFRQPVFEAASQLDALELAVELDRLRVFDTSICPWEWCAF